MNPNDLRKTIVPLLNVFCGVPVIEADGNGPKPDGSHVTYKLTNPYGKDKGREVEEVAQDGTGFKMIRTESFKTTISFSAYDFDDDISRELAQKVYDWFAFYGYDDLLNNNIAVIEQTDIINRDAFVVENYERRNGFDVIIRISREMSRNVDIVEDINIDGQATK